jgi:methyl-accepting chemotaxis protein
MHRLRTMSVRAKLFAGFGAVLALLLVLVAVAVNQMGGIKDRAGFVSGTVVPSSTAVGQMELQVDSLVRHQREFLGTTGPDKRSVLRETGKDRAAFLRTLADYQRVTGDAQAASLLRGQFTRYVAGTAGLARAAGHGRAAGETVLADNDALFSKIEAELAHLASQRNAVAVQSADKVRASYSLAETIIYVIGAIAVLLGIGVAWFLGRLIRRSVQAVLECLSSLSGSCAANLKAGLEAMAAGDLTVAVEANTPPIENPGGDEIGQAAAAVNAIRDATHASVVAYNAMRAELATLIGRVAQVAGSVSAASEQMAASSAEAGRAVAEMATAIGEMAAGSDRQTRLAEAATETSSGTSVAAIDARSVAEQGAASAGQASAAMDEVNLTTRQVIEAIRGLSERSTQIGGFVETITGLADQTNLLALNAAIEAARAGEQGRGFAVVAEEVRKLAEQSQQAAAHVAGLVGEIQDETASVVRSVDLAAGRTEEGTCIVEQTREAFAAIDQAVRDVADRIEEIREATGEVASVAVQTGAAAQQISASTEETSASAQQLAVSAQDLALTASQLEQLVARFTTA